MTMLQTGLGRGVDVLHGPGPKRWPARRVEGCMGRRGRVVAIVPDDLWTPDDGGLLESDGIAVAGPMGQRHAMHVTHAGSNGTHLIRVVHCLAGGRAGCQRSAGNPCIRKSRRDLDNPTGSMAIARHVLRDAAPAGHWRKPNEPGARRAVT